MATGQDYNFNVVPKPRVPRPPSASDPRPEVLPTPPVEYSPSRPSVAIGELAKSFIPQANMDDIRGRLTAMAGPGAGYGNFIGEAARSAGGMLRDAKTLTSEPVGSQPWWNAGVRTAAEIAGTSRIFIGGKGRADPYRGTTTRNPFGGTTMATEAELPPTAANAVPYKLHDRPTFRDYYDHYKNAVAQNDDVGARNIVSMAYKEGKTLPVSDLNHMPHEMINELMSKYGIH